MNRSFRSIWNPSLGTYVAAAETQPSRGRTVSGTRTARRQACRASAGPLVMEPRIVFDAAIAATVADVQSDAGSDITTAEATAEWVADDDGEAVDAPETAEAVDAVQSADNADTTDTDPQATAPEQAPLREIIFVDPVASSLGSHLQDSGAEIIYLSADRDGVEQIAEALQGQTNIAAIHIVSHGVEGRLMLGNTVLDTASMQAQHQQALQAIGAALSEEGDILIYGCNFTAGETGLTAANLLAEITGADVAASVDATGHADKNGNWTLETSIGHVEAVALSPSDWMGRLDLLIQNQGTVGTNALASAIMGPGVTINSATYSGGANQAGVFSTGAGISFGSNILEFTDGAIFTTHSNTTSVAGPNNSGGLTSNAPGTDNDPDFNAASGGFNTYDASFIVITFTPDVFPGASVGDVGRMTASLVFGSEEYNEYVYSGFNDTIGLWVNGVNVALAPNGLAIGIDTINDAATFNPANGSASNDPNPGHSTTSFTSANPNLYVNNSTNTYNTQMDGFTVTISLTFDVIVGQQNTIKLGIADTGDASLDSWLFVKAQSLQTAFVPENDSVSTPANVPAAVDLTANDFNLNGGALDIVAINGDAISPGGSVVLASGVTVTLDGGGNVTVSGDGVNAVSDTFTYTVRNADGQTANAIVTVNITAPVLNNAPVAVDDSFAAGEDDAAAVRGNALSNDSDSDGNPLTAVAQTNVAGSNGGLFSINTAGQVTFNPNGAFEHLAAGQTTTTSFTYTVSDGQGGTDTAIVTVTVTGANDAPVAVDDSFGVGEDAVATVVGNALGNDSDVDGGTLAATPQTGVAGTGGGLFSINAAGQVTFNPNGEFEHLAAGQTATTSFTYTVSDGQGGADTATVTVTVTGANDAPVLDLDADGSDSASGFLVTGPNLIVNGDFSAGNTGFSSDYATGTTSSVLANEETYFIGDASVDWMPHWGQDNVTADPYGDPSGGMMYINGSPTAGQVYWRQTVAVTPGTDYQFSVWATNVNHWEGFSGTGDADPLVELSINGVLVGSGRLSYLNAGVWQQLSGVWSSGGATSATLTMSSAAGIAMGNDLAVTGFSLAEGFIVGVNDYETTYHEGGAGIAVVDSDVLVQDTDSTQLVSATVVLTQAFDGDTLSVDGALPAGVLANVDNSVPGQITVQLTGAASLADYQAALLAIRFSSSSENPDESLRVLEVTVNDGIDTSNLARTFITVTAENDAPALVPGSQPGAQTGDDGQLITPLDVSGAFTDVDGDTLGYSASGLPPGLVIDPVTGVISGTLTGNASQGGPANDGVYSVTVTATDPSGATVDSVFSWTVGNPAPVAVNDDFAAGEDDGAAVVGNALTNDSDPDGDTLIATAQTNVAGSHGGLFSINAAGQVTFNPNGEFEGLTAGQTATTSFTYTVSDGQGGTDTATVTVTVTGANDAPVAVDDGTFVVTPGRSVTGNVLTNDSDADGDSLSVTGFAVDTDRDGVADSFLPGQTAVIRGVGTLVVQADGSFVFAPASGYAGNVPVATYTVSDGHAQSTASLRFEPVPVVALPPAPTEPAPAPAPAQAPVSLPTVTQPTELGAQAVAAPVPPAAVSSGAVAPVLHVLYAVNTAHTEGFIVASGLSLGTSDPLLAEAMAQAPDGLLFEGMAEASAASLLAPDGLHAGAPSLHVQHAVRHEPVTTEHGSYIQRVVRSTQMESRLGDAVVRAQTELHMAEDALDLMRMVLDAQGSAPEAPAVAPDGSGAPSAAPGGADRQSRGIAPADTSVVEDELVIEGEPAPEPADDASEQPTPPAPTALGFRAQLARMAQEQGGWGRPVTRAAVAT